MKQKTNLESIKDIPFERGSSNTDVWIVLLCDAGDYALYLNKSGGYFSGFEVHKIRFKKARTCCIHGTVFDVPDRRVIASSEEFGRYAWHFQSLKMVFRDYPIFFPYRSMINEKVALERAKIDGVMINDVSE